MHLATIFCFVASSYFHILMNSGCFYRVGLSVWFLAEKFLIMAFNDFFFSGNVDNKPGKRYILECQEL